MQIKSGHQLAVSQVDVCVLGGGPVGMMAMLLAKQQGLNAIQLIARPNAPLAHAVPRTYAIAPQVQAALAAVGVWGLLSEAHIQRCEHMKVSWQHGDTAEPIHLSAAEAGVEQLCSFVAEDDLIHALQTATAVTRASLNPIFYDSDAQPSLRQQEGGMCVTVSNHAPIHAQLCIIAQGAASSAAQQLNLAPSLYDYAHSAVVAVLHSNTPAPHTAWQWLGGAAQGHDVLALLPLPTESSESSEPHAARYGLVWSQSSEQAQQWVGKNNALLAAVQARVGSAVGQLSLHSTTQQFPLYKSAAPYIAPHAVVVGDAAHKIHPLAGQGLNLGFEDVMVLFDVLAQREAWRSLGDERLLARYARQRSASAQTMGAVVHALANRGLWPAWLGTLAVKGLQFQNDWSRLGKPLRSAMVGWVRPFNKQ
jgi:2-polyprenylphenol 6-hydroxylase